MLWWYWLCGLISAPVLAWWGQPWYASLGYATFFYFVGTLGAGIQNAIKYKSLWIYQLWDAALFVAAAVTAFFFYAFPRDVPGLSTKDLISVYDHALAWFVLLYFIGWVVLKRIFSPRVVPKDLPSPQSRPASRDSIAKT